MNAPTDIPAIKAAAAKRAQDLKLPYAGALMPSEAYALMQAGAKLVDVRATPEVLYVGRVPGSLFVEWATYPGHLRNPEFLAQLAQAVAPGDTLMFLCRSGNRSHAAAAVAAQAGWESYNVLEGFEGDKDAAQHRGALGGWRKAGLPWMQA